MIKRPKRKGDFILSLVSLNVCGEPEELDETLDFIDQEVTAGLAAIVTACNKLSHVDDGDDKCNTIANQTKFVFLFFFTFQVHTFSYSGDSCYEIIGYFLIISLLVLVLCPSWPHFHHIPLLPASFP